MPLSNGCAVAHNTLVEMTDIFSLCSRTVCRSYQYHSQQSPAPHQTGQPSRRYHLFLVIFGVYLNICGRHTRTHKHIPWCTLICAWGAVNNAHITGGPLQGTFLLYSFSHNGT